MSLRIREDGRILCAAMHLAEPGDTYLNDHLHYILSVELKAIVTEGMYQLAGRSGHSRHGEWWWVHQVPEDVVLESQNNYSRWKVNER